MDILARDRLRLYDALLGLSYDDVLISCASNPLSAGICEDPLFWEAKAQQDFNLSLVDSPLAVTASPREKYLSLLSNTSVAVGSEAIIPAEECLRRAIIEGKPDLACYFAEQVDDWSVLIEATADRELFNKFVDQYGIDIYSNPELLSAVLIGAIQNQNFPLIRDLAPTASSIIVNGEQVEIILDEASSTSNYELIEYLHNYFPFGDVDEWLLQAALLKQDKDFSEQLIISLLQKNYLIELANALVRAGDYERLVSLLELSELKGNENIGHDIVEIAARKGRLSMIKLVAENKFFNVARRRFWFEEALDIALERGDSEMVSYLENLLNKI